MKQVYMKWPEHILDKTSTSATWKANMLENIMDKIYLTQ